MKRVLALAALLLVPLLAPLAAAEPPAAASWSPYDATVIVNATALAKAGPTVGAALAPEPDASKQCTAVAPAIPGVGETPGTPSVTCKPDLVVVDVDHGGAFNGVGNLGVGGQARAQGRSLVAVSRDGRTVASVGHDFSTQQGATPGAQPLKLYVDSVPAGSNFSAGPVTSRNVYVAGLEARGLVLSDDGTRVAVLTDDAPNMTVRAYAVTAGSLDSVFALTLAGKAAALGADARLDSLYAAGTLPRGNDTVAGVVLVPFNGGRASASYLDPTNNTVATSLDVTPSGGLVALGTSAGRLAALDGATLAMGGEFLVGSAPIQALAVADDAKHAAAAVAGALTLLNLTSLQPASAWRATLDGQVNSLDFNATGAILVAGVNGTAGGFYAYGLDDATPFWSIPGDARTVAINDAGTFVAWAQGRVVHGQKLARAFSFEYPGGLKAGPARGLRAGSSTAFDLVLRNNGSAPETFAFSATPDAFLTVHAEPPLVDVRPGDTRHVSLVVTSAPPFLGTHTLNVTATALGSRATDNVAVSVAFQGVANVTFQVNQTEYLVTPGLPTSVLLSVVNNGTTSASVGLRTTQATSAGPAWGLEVDQTSFLVPQGSITTVRATLTPPASTANGTSDAVTFALEGPNVSDAVVLNFRVNPHLGVDIQATGRVKFVEPGKVASFNVTVLNNGSLVRDFTAFYDVTASSGRPWPVEMATEPFRLAPGETRTVAIKVLAPADAKPDERVSILVRARSVPLNVNESFVEANVTLFANAVAPPTTTPTTASSNPVPFPSLLAAAACIGLAALARRRRSA